MKKMQTGGAKTYTGAKGKTTTTGSIPSITTHKGKKGSTEVVNYYSDNGKVVRHSGSKGKTVIDSSKNFKVKEHEGSKGKTRVFEDKTGKSVIYLSKKKGSYFKNTDSKGTITYKKGGTTKK